jgi:hypothetical protein
MYVGNALLSSTCQIRFSHVLEMCYTFQSWQRICYQLVIKQNFKVEFETTKCWLKSPNSNKVIVEAIQEGRFYKLVGVVQSLVAKM